MRVEEIKEQITAKRQQIELGVGADREHILQMDIIELEDELSKLGQTEQELINEKNEALRKIAQELTPRINNMIYADAEHKQWCAEERERLSARIAEIDAELTQEVALPEAEEGKAEAVELVLPTVDGQPLETFTDYPALIRFEVELGNEAIHNMYKPIIADLRNKISLSNELELSLKQRNVELEKDYQLCAAENLELVQDNVKLTNDNHQIAIERDEAFVIRDNALKQIEELAQELENVKVELNRSKEFKALTEAERTAEAEADRQKLLNSRIKIYNVTDKEGEYPRVTKVCYLAETGELHEFHYFHKGRYLEITEDEALAIQAMNKPVDMPEVDEEEIFQEDASAEGPLPINESEDHSEQREDVEVDGTFTERRKSLGDTEYRLATLEQQMKEVQRHVFARTTGLGENADIAS